jgi:aromatic-L-amino-acid decarboxylase
MDPDLESVLQAPIAAAEVGDIPAEAFREAAHDAVSWMVEYLEQVEKFPVLSRIVPGQLQAELPAEPPAAGEPLGDLLRDFETLILPGITHWNHPSFHGYFAISGSAPGILGEMLTAALNVNGMVWRSSPAVTELELHVLGWIRGLLGLPADFFGIIQDTASSSSHLALAGARLRAYPEVREQGLFGLPRGRIYLSEEAHSSIEKAALALGFGTQDIKKVPADRYFRMDPRLLEQAMSADKAEGIRPVAVVATVGTTSTTSVDPVRELLAISRTFGAWFHVDAAYAGAAALLPECRPLFDGWEEADSIVFNPHKWLFTPVDCSVLYTRDRHALRDALSLVPEYLRAPGGEEPVTNLMDYGVALGRRFRSLKLWFVLRAFGVQGLQDRIRAHIAMARLIRDQITATPGWEVLSPVLFSTVVFRRNPGTLTGSERDAFNLALLDAINASGIAFLSHTRLRGEIWLRWAIGNLKTEPRHLEATWDFLRQWDPSDAQHSPVKLP